MAAAEGSFEMQTSRAEALETCFLFRATGSQRGKKIITESNLGWNGAKVKLTQLNVDNREF